MKNVAIRNEILTNNIDAPEAILAAILLKGCAWNDEDGEYYYYSCKLLAATIFGDSCTRHDIKKISNGIEYLKEQGYVKEGKPKKANLYHLNIENLSEDSKTGYMLVDKDKIKRIFNSYDDINKYNILLIYLLVQRYRGKSNIMPEKYHYKFYIYGTSFLKEQTGYGFAKIKFILDYLRDEKILYCNLANDFNTKRAKKGYLRNYYCLYEDKNLLKEYTKELFGSDKLRNSQILTRTKRQSGLAYYHICNNRGKYNNTDLRNIVLYLNNSSKFNGLDCYAPVVDYCKQHNIDISSDLVDLNIPQDVKDLFSVN